MTPYQRIFGTGPRGLAFGLMSFALAFLLDDVMDLAPLFRSQAISIAALGVGSLITVVIVAWSLVALPPYQRGREFIKTGPFAYVRHPFYAAFLIGFDFGFAVFMDGWIFLVWAILQYPLWHLNIAGEERLMEQEFGQAYREYCRSTGRFLPRLVR